MEGWPARCLSSTYTNTRVNSDASSWIWTTVPISRIPLLVAGPAPSVLLTTTASALLVAKVSMLIVTSCQPARSVPGEPILQTMARIQLSLAIPVRLGLMVHTRAFRGALTAPRATTVLLLLSRPRSSSPTTEKPTNQTTSSK